MYFIKRESFLLSCRDYKTEIKKCGRAPLISSSEATHTIGNSNQVLQIRRMKSKLLYTLGNYTKMMKNISNR